MLFALQTLKISTATCPNRNFLFFSKKKKKSKYGSSSVDKEFTPKVVFSRGTVYSGPLTVYQSRSHRWLLFLKIKWWKPSCFECSLPGRHSPSQWLIVPPEDGQNVSELWGVCVQSSLEIWGGICSRNPMDTKIRACSSPWYKLVQYLQITYAHLPYTVYYKCNISRLLISITM